MVYAFTLIMLVMASASKRNRTEKTGIFAENGSTCKLSFQSKKEESNFLIIFTKVDGTTAADLPTIEEIFNH
jgi:hypothetical protein